MRGIAAQQFDEWRVIPRILIFAYGAFAFYVGDWFMGLETPNAAQSAFVSTVWGASAGWFGLYVKTGRKSAE